MAECFYATVNNVRHIIMRMWLVLYAILLSLTLLLYETVIAVLMRVDSRKTVKEDMVKISTSSESDCRAACRKETAIDCRSFLFHNASRICLLSAVNQAGDTSVQHTGDKFGLHGTRVIVGNRKPRNALNEGLEENVDKLWHDLEKYQNDKNTLQQFEKLVVQELKIKSKEIEELRNEKAQQGEEISALKNAVSKLYHQNSGIGEKLKDIETEQTNQQHQISGLEFSDEKLTAGMGKLIVQTEELVSKVDSLSQDNKASKDKLDNLESLTRQLQTNVATLLQQQKLVHDVVERIALLSEKTSVMTDRVQALQEHQTISEKEITGLKGTMEKLVASMRAVDKSQLRVSGHMDTLDYNISDHDMLMKELLVTQTRDTRTLRKTLDELIDKSAAQTQAFEGLKTQTSQTSGRFNALTSSIAKVSERNDQLSGQIDQLKQDSLKTVQEFNKKTELHSGDIQQMKSAQQVLMNQLHKLGNAEVVLASELRQFPNLVNQLTDDVRRTAAQGGKLDSEMAELKSNAESLKMAISNLQVQQSLKPVVVPVNRPETSSHREAQSHRLEDELELLNLQRLGKHHHSSRRRRTQEAIDTVHGGDGRDSDRSDVHTQAASSSPHRMELREQELPEQELPEQEIRAEHSGEERKSENGQPMRRRRVFSNHMRHKTMNTSFYRRHRIDGGQ